MLDDGIKHLKHALWVMLACMPIGAWSQVDTLRQVSLDEVSVKGVRQGMMQSRSSLGALETINRMGLTKMACCTLSSSFENTATTQTTYSDAVTGTRQIQMLGLSSVYTQTMAENVPTLRGLANAFGWDYTPSAWLEGISIAKGAGTVVNGYEGITGQMNLDFSKPNEGRLFYMDLYTDTDLHNEVNAIAKHQFSPQLFSALMLHTTQTTMPDHWHKRMDGNGDGFMDMPKLHNYHIYNRWLYADGEHGVQSRLDVRFAYDEREAGQMGNEGLGMKDVESVDAGSSWHVHPLYQVKTRNLHFQASNKTGIAIGDKEGQSIGIINSITLHGLRTRYGDKILNGDQLSYYGNVIFNSDLGSKAHQYQVGMGYQYDKTVVDYTHSILPSSFKYQPREGIVGAFAEYTNTMMENLTMQIGSRIDHNSRYGWLFTPRLNVKYTSGRWLVARLSVGRGYRSVNPLVENLGVMASSRTLYNDFGSEDFPLEKAWNMGGNLIFTIPIWDGQEATLSLDYYHVCFDERVLTDLYAHPQMVCLYGQGDKSRTDTWQVDLSVPLFEGMTLYAAWKYNSQQMAFRKMDDVVSPPGQTINSFSFGETYHARLPLVGAYKALVNLQYATNMRRWVFDATCQLNGRSSLPTTIGDNGVWVEGHSPAYTLLYAQVTRRFKSFEIYVGGENLLNYKQTNPIIGWDNPFSNRFDASVVWAPITGSKYYVGLRLNLGKFM